MVILFRPNLIMLFIIFTFSNISLGYAYIGPGAGVSLLGSLLGVLLAIGSLIVLLLAWPIRKALKKRKKKHEDAK